MFAHLASLLLLVRAATAISWNLILDPSSTDSNVWTSLTYTITVPQGPPSDVDSGPWFFWAGLQPEGGGVVQPVLQWGENAPGYVNPDPSFPTIWAMVLWTVPADNFNNNNAAISNGVWADQGAQIQSTVNYANGQWTQTSTVLTGAAAGQSNSQTITASTYFNTDAAGDSNANFFVLESELDGSQTSEWNFDVQFSDISLTAETSNGVEALCSAATSFSDGNGYATIDGYSISADGRTCSYSSVTLSPP